MLNVVVGLKRPPDRDARDLGVGEGGAAADVVDDDSVGPVVLMVTLSTRPLMILPQLAARKTTAMARSAAGPSLGRAAGTREIVACAYGQGRPLLRMPARTRSLVSRAG